MNWLLTRKQYSKTNDVDQHELDDLLGVPQQWTFPHVLRTIRCEVNRVLQRGMYRGNQNLNGICLEYYRNREWLLTFPH
jgi:hypothetical protein